MPGTLDSLYDMLRWDASEDSLKRVRGIIECDPDFDCGVLIQPLGRKRCWDNCAKLLCERSDDDLEELLPCLLEWLQDLNWPGAMVVLGRLRHFEESMLKAPLKSAVNIAVLGNDEEWLGGMALLIKNERLASLLDEGAADALSAHYHLYWK